MQRLEFIEDCGDLKNLNEKYLEQGWKVKDFVHGTSSSRFPVGLVLIESPVKEQLNELIDTLKKTADENSDSDNSSLNAVIDSLF
jgi:hypothetical protein